MSIETHTSLTDNQGSSDHFTNIFFLQVGQDKFILHPDIQDLLSLGDIRCKEAEICAHDLSHAMRATQNAFVLLDMLQVGEPSSVPFSSNIAKPDLALALHIHDLGYGAGDSTVEINGKEVVGHEEASWQFLMRTMHRFAHGHPTRRYFAQHYDMFRAGIVGTAKGHEEIIQRQKDDPNIQNLFTLLISTADKTDYFRRDRVDQLPSPTDIQPNPYLALAHAVKNYELSFDQEQRTLYYRVKLHDNTLFSPNPQAWKETLPDYYPQVFGLLEAVAQIAGYRFVVEVQ